MAKVKKVVGVTGERNITARGSKKVAKAARSGTTRTAATTTKARTMAKPVAKKSGARKSAPMKKSGSRSRTTTTGGKRAAVASGVKGKRGKKPQKRPSPLKLVRGRKVMTKLPVVTVAIKELDPVRKCGPNTSVQFLYRVDESVDGRRTAHLVFFDRHGWYCEHGRTCPAVGHAKKHNGQIARVS